MADELLPIACASRNIPRGEPVEINERVWFVDHDGFRVVLQGLDTPLFRFEVANKEEARLVSVALRLSGLARQEEVAHAFGHSVASQRRWERRYEDQGAFGVRSLPISGRPTKVGGGQDSYIRRWFQNGDNNRQIACRLGVDEATIRRALKRLGLQRQVPNEGALALSEGLPQVGSRDQSRGIEASVDAEEPTAERDQVGDVSDPLDRTFDRVMARMGLLDDALPAFANADGLPRVGVFLAVPLLASSGVLEAFQRVYRSIGPAFYGLRTTVVCLLFLALLRIKRAEHLKEHHPQDLGRLLGLDRAPEVKTLRRKLHALASRGLGMDLMHELAKARVERVPDTIGVLYLDGHVREYHGKHKIAKTRVTQRGRCAPGATDTWVNDVQGDPLFVVHSEINDGLTKMLEPILQEAQQLAGPGREITVVFDRGGWSPKLFERLIATGHHIITYRKGASRKLLERAFEERKLWIDGRKVSYKLHDAPRVRVGRIARSGPRRQFIWMRQVTRLREGGRQTQVLTDREDLGAEVVLYLMFNRWRQENYFKYMEAEFALDALVEYGAGPLSDGIDRPNPDIKSINKQIQKARATLAAAEQAIGGRLRDTPQARGIGMDDFDATMAELYEQQAQALAAVDDLTARRKAFPKRVSSTDEKTLNPERRLVADAIKMSAYQMEGKLMRLLQDSYKRNDDEGRTLLHAAFQSRGSIEVTATEILVTLEPQSSPHRTLALSKLCDKLNALEETKFPGSDRVLKLAVRVHEPVSS